MDSENSSSTANNGRNFNRRTVLKAAGATTGLSAIPTLIGSVEATDAELKTGETHFTEVFLTHSGSHGHDTHVDSIEMPYAVEGDKGRVSVGSAHVEDFQASFRTGFREALYSEGEKIVPPDGRHLAVHDPFKVPYTSFRLLSKPYQPPTIDIHPRGNDISVTVEGETAQVAPETSREIVLDKSEVVLKNGEKVEVKPNLNIRNYGRLDVFGREDAIVLPRNSDIDWVNHRVMHYISEAETNSRVSVKKTDDFIIVKIESDA